MNSFEAFKNWGECGYWWGQEVVVLVPFERNNNRGRGVCKTKRKWWGFVFFHKMASKKEGKTVANTLLKTLLEISLLY